MKERQFRAPRPRKSTLAQLEARKRYAEKHPEKIKARRQAGAKKLTAYCKQRRINLRIETFTHYGPNGVLRCSWEGCEISDIDMLVLDHIANDGAKERKRLGGQNARGWNFYNLLKNLGFPSGYQTLCCNHNHKKELTRSRKS
jgi:hypothetical protein